MALNSTHTCCIELIQCKSAQQIKRVLKQFSAFANEEKQWKIDDNYTIIQLLNDYDHIKYDHNVDNDNHEFAKMYKFLKQEINTDCNIKKCGYVERHYMDRSKLSNQYVLRNKSVDNDSKSKSYYIMNIMSKMHVYFIHSYDINRLKLDEINIDKTIEMTSQTISRTGQNLNVNRYKKYTEHVIEYDDINLQTIHRLLADNNIFIEYNKLKVAFGNYDDKNELLSDLIEAYYSKNDAILSIESQILVAHLPRNRDVRHSIYGLMLFEYFTNKQLNDENFVKIATQIIYKWYPDIDVNEFAKCALNNHINGKMFSKTSSCFRNSIQFSKLFKSIKGYKKKYLTQIFVKIKKWEPDSLKVKINKIIEPTEQCEIKENKMKPTDNVEEDDIYSIGTRFFYWNSVQHHPHYIQSKYFNFKVEMIQSKLFGSDFDVKMWRHLTNECEILLQTDVVKRITSNGFYRSIYKIEPSLPFSIQHIMALKLYTDYTKLCNMLCSILRVKKQMKICQIANWVRLLTECVQCYGTSIKLNKNKQYFRGVNRELKFSMLVTRFNLPTSTTTNFDQATRFCDDGLVFELMYYRDRYDVFQFDCSILSGFDIEKETLFFGGQTVLKISCIWQYVGEWIGYRKYMLPIDAILRMINGVTIDKHRILTNSKHQQTMYELLNHILCEFNSKKSMLKLPKYIENLLKYHLS
eukprot:450803_1